MNEKLSFQDAVILARGCHDYNGGYCDPDSYGAFHHGVQTVINVLEAAEKGWDTQLSAIYRIGKEADHANA